MTFPGTLAKLLVALLASKVPGLRPKTKEFKKNKNKHQRGKKQQKYPTRPKTRNSFARNHKTVTHTKRSLGSISQIVIVSMLTLIFGLIYVAESTKATSFDYEISKVEDEITEMNAKKDDLAVEKARLNSVATAKNSTVAAAMEDATVMGYVAD